MCFAQQTLGGGRAENAPETALLLPTLQHAHGGVDICDQYNGLHLSEHTANTFFCRRVFEQALVRATLHAWFLLEWWVITDTANEAEKLIKELRENTLRSPGIELGQVVQVQAELATLKIMRRAHWLRHFSRELMPKHQEGNKSKGHRRAPRPRPMANGRIWCSFEDRKSRSRCASKACRGTKSR